MRTLLICHHDAPIDREGLVRWLASFSTVAGVVIIREPGGRMRQRISREIARVGWARFIDVIAYRVYHRFRFAAADRAWEAAAVDALRGRFPAPAVPEIVVTSPNSAEAVRFIRDCQPDLAIARCKTLLREEVFATPRLGTFVMHPGICPEYRNAHGCFWALASGDDRNVGTTLLKVDRGVDTGPVYGYFRVMPDPGRESHVVLQHRAVLEHLDAIRDTLLAIERGTATTISTAGRPSAAWGQPWMSAYLKIRRRYSGVRAPGSWAPAGSKRGE